MPDVSSLVARIVPACHRSVFTQLVLFILWMNFAIGPTHQPDLITFWTKRPLLTIAAIAPVGARMVIEADDEMVFLDVYGVYVVACRGCAGGVDPGIHPHA
ncbi:hypothetical protein TRP66_12485 [Pseudomonas sp. JDS28PS106]|uniref:hypothetical protein n=1 Tax=Pseudomonas sp. JDS28PS106 TaxID=2497235 RepID=UPI002FD4BD4B